MRASTYFFFWGYLNDLPSNADALTRKRVLLTFRLLVAASIIVWVCDLIGLILLYMKIILVRYSFLGLVYSVKLSLEFFVLNYLVNMSELKSRLLQRGNLSGSIAASTVFTPLASENLRTENQPRDELAMDKVIRNLCVACSSKFLKQQDVSLDTILLAPLTSQASPHDLHKRSMRAARLTSLGVVPDADGISGLEQQYLGRATLNQFQ